MPIDKRIANRYIARMLVEVSPITALQEQVVAKGSQKAVAAELGISPSFLNDILQGHRQAPEKVLAQLKLRRAIIRETRKGKHEAR